MEMTFRPTPEHEVRIADVCCVPRKRFTATAGDGYLMGAPELVDEVISLSNTVAEINDKMYICMKNGCVSFWVVDPSHKLVSITEGCVTTHFAARKGASISCCVFNDRLPVEAILEEC